MQAVAGLDEIDLIAGQVRAIPDSELGRHIHDLENVSHTQDVLATTILEYLEEDASVAKRFGIRRSEYNTLPKRAQARLYIAAHRIASLVIGKKR